jgi:hypothetical protein
MYGTKDVSCLVVNFMLRLHFRKEKKRKKSCLCFLYLVDATNVTGMIIKNEKDSFTFLAVNFKHMEEEEVVEKISFLSFSFSFIRVLPACLLACHAIA